jgi:hypothetical protein
MFDADPQVPDAGQVAASDRDADPGRQSRRSRATIR